MANIRDYLNNIINAVFGKDVRQSIHDSIEEINNEIETNTIKQNLLEQKYDEQIRELANEEPQLPEIVDARCGFDTLGGLLKQKVYHFDTVQEMKNCLTLIPGDVVQTLGYYIANDGGGATYKIVGGTSRLDYQENLENSLYANLIVENKTINILKLGVTNNTDIGVIINDINSKSIDVFVPEGEYKIETTINPISNSKIIINGTLNNNTNSPTIKIENSYINLYCKKINAKGNSIPLLFESNTNATKCMYNNIEIDTIVSNNHAIYMHSIKKGIVYNNIKFKNISAGNDYYGIFIKTEYDANKSYINENTIIGGKISSGLYGIYIDTDIYSNNHEVNGMKFNEICFEGVTNAIYMKNARNNVVNYPRTAEVSGFYAVIDDNADGNIFNFLENISYDKFDITNLNEGRATYNHFNGTITDGTGGRLAKDFITYNKRLQIRNLLNKTRYLQIGNDNISVVDGIQQPYYIPNTRVGNYIRMSSTLSPDIYLNQYYGSAGLNELYINCVNERPFKLYDNYNNLILDYDGSGSFTKHFICRDNTNENNDVWTEI